MNVIPLQIPPLTAPLVPQPAAACPSSTGEAFLAYLAAMVGGDDAPPPAAALSLVAEDAATDSPPDAEEDAVPVPDSPPDAEEVIEGSEFAELPDMSEVEIGEILQGEEAPAMEVALPWNRSIVVEEAVEIKGADKEIRAGMGADTMSGMQPFANMPRADHDAASYERAQPRPLLSAALPSEPVLAEEPAPGRPRHVRLSLPERMFSAFSAPVDDPQSLPGDRAGDISPKPVMPAPVEQAPVWQSEALPATEEGQPVSTVPPLRLQSSPHAASLRAVPPPVAGDPPELVARISRQIVQGAGEGTEIRLDPPELGNLRFLVTTTEHGVALRLQADHPDTAELLRRHIEILTADLRQAGYASVDVSVDRGERQAPAARPSPTPADPPAPDVLHVVAAPLTRPAGGLDLRL